MHSPSQLLRCRLQCDAGPWPWAEALSEDDDETWLSSGASTPDSVEEAPHANGALPNGAAAVESGQNKGNGDAGREAAQNGGLAVTGVLRGALGGLGLPEGLRGLQVSFEVENISGAITYLCSICWLPVCHSLSKRCKLAGNVLQLPLQRLADFVETATCAHNHSGTSRAPSQPLAGCEPGFKPRVCVQLPCALSDALSASFRPARLQGKSPSVIRNMPQAITPSTTPTCSMLLKQ